MISENKKKIIMYFIISSIGLINDKIKVISYIKNQEKYLFKFYITNKNKELNECISDILFEFEALQDKQIYIDKKEIKLELDKKIELEDKEILLFAKNDAKRFFRVSVGGQNLMHNAHNR